MQVDSSILPIAKAGMGTIETLSGKSIASPITLLSSSDHTPQGCSVYVVSTTASVFLEIKDRIANVDAEIQKAQVKMKRAAEGAAKVRKTIAGEDYVKKASASAKESDGKLLAEFDAQMRNYEKSIEQFERLKLEERK